MNKDALKATFRFFSFGWRCFLKGATLIASDKERTLPSQEELMHQYMQFFMQEGSDLL